MGKRIDQWKKTRRLYRFDRRAANRVVNYFHKRLVHIEGELAGKPLRLERWQRKLLRRLFGWMKRSDGTRRFRTLYLEVPRKNGKALDIDTPILTTKGWKKHGDLMPGDCVFGPDGKPKVVQAVGPKVMGPCYSLTFSDKTQIIAHAEHEWDTIRTWFTGRRRGERRALPLVTSRKIAETLTMSGRGDYVHSIEIAKSLKTDETDIPIPPYTFGYWLGDGTSACGAITTADPEVIESIRMEGVPVKKSAAKYLYALTTGTRNRADRENSITAKLRALGVLNNKHVPECYLVAGEFVRKEVLAGLIDSDGHVSRVGAVEVCLTNKMLADSVCYLIRTLGMKPMMTASDAKIYGRIVGKRYRIQFHIVGDFPLRVPRKRARIRTKDTTRAKRKTIIDCLPIGDRLANCIQVEGGFYLAGDGLTKTHNSTICSGLALYLMHEDNEPGARVVAAAADRDQAAIVFDVAKRMVEAAPKLNEKLICFKRAIVDHASASNFLVLSAEAKTKHGKNLHGIVLDEVHAQSNRELYDVLHTSQSARRQPMEVLITTAGFDRNSICWELHEYTEKVNQGIIEDDSFLGVIYAAGPEDDWTKPETWFKANPNLGVSKKLEYMKKECERAKKTPGYENTFKRLDLNIWTEQDSRWLAIDVWDETAKFKFTAEELEGRECYAGLDLASTQDITAFVLAFPYSNGTVRVLPFYWIPKDTAVERAKAHRVPYPEWIRDGHVFGTQGNRVDYDAIRLKILELCSQYNVKEVAYDRWNATQLAGQLEQDGLELIPIGMGFKQMTAPAKELERLVAEGKLHHAGEPVLRWMAKNVAIEQNADGEIRPSKKKSNEKIDGIVALIMALDRLSRAAGDMGSAYEERGIISV